MPYKHTKFQVESRQGAGLVSKRNTNREKNREKIRKNRENRLSAYLSHHRRDIAQTFMVNSPNDALQSHKVSGQNSPRGRVGGQKSLKNPEIRES